MPETQSNPASEPPLLSIRGAFKHFVVRRGLLQREAGRVRAVDGVDLDIGAGETVGLVGESGCGKSTLARLVLRLEEPNGGQALYQSEDVFRLPQRDLQRYRRGVQMIFQDPYSSLNPRTTALDAVINAWRINPDVRPSAEWRTKALELLALVGLDHTQARKFPHQLSGGQRQRVSIARALALQPRLVVCDEPVSALDVSVQAQVLVLLQDLQQRFGISYLFISHDLGVVRRISRRVAVMYLGRIVETGAVSDVFERPAHPYTESLLAAAPVVDPERRTLETRSLLQGDPPSPLSPPSGCRFRTRCPKAQQLCAEVDPSLEPVDAKRHQAACHFPNVGAR